MLLMPEVSPQEAIEIFVKYCAKNSTPADIFNFDGFIPTAKLKYSPLMTYYADYNYTALVEITTQSEYNTTSSLGGNTTAYRENKRNTTSGFFESMYEDYADTRYTNTQATNKYMDRTNGTGCFLVFGSSGSDCIEEKLWPAENIDVSILIRDINDSRVQNNPLVALAVDNCISTLNTDFFNPPASKIEYVIKSNIQYDLENRYQKCSYTIKDYQYDIIESSWTKGVFFVPYYEISYMYNGVAYSVKIAAHNHANDSTGFFGGTKGVVVGDLPVFTKQSGGLLTKLKARKERKNEKEEGKEFFMREIAPKIIFTA